MIKNRIPTLADKACRYCCQSSRKDNILSSLEELPFHITPTLESEEHALTECPAYHHLRSALSDSLKVKCLLLFKEYRIIMEGQHTMVFGTYLSHCYGVQTSLRKDIIANGHLCEKYIVLNTYFAIISYRWQG